ncbi:twin-arginine translocase TatA/TatE family subunit [candidate division KSB1 bacterium]|nr:twin-arginine translocase TatA/TatE family subunit [candidate division KSB1 bacterium]
MSLGMPEILIIFFIVLLLFGAKKLPELAKGLGKGLKEFKQATKEPDIEEKPQVESGEKKQ